MARLSSLPCKPLLTLLLWGLAALPAHSAEPRWMTVGSGHFSVTTDAGDKRGREVALRFEQMRAVFAGLLLKTRLNEPEPLEIFALGSAPEYAQTAPIRSGQVIGEPGFFVPGEDRNYIVLNATVDDAWHAIAYDFARMLLNYNYPPVQPWFDEGFAQYFASIQLDNKQVQVGSPPGSFVSLLNSQNWIPMADLFSEKSASRPGGLFSAESWIVMHYLVSKNKLQETGNYFGLVENQNVAVPEAIQQAYGVSAAQFEQAVKDYFHGLSAPAPAASATQTGSPGVQTLPTPVEAENFPASTTPVADVDGEALLAEIRLRLPERRAQAMQELEGMTKQEASNIAIAHRALAWGYLENQEYPKAIEELGSAMQIDPRDRWTRYYLSLVKYRAGESSGGQYPGLPNMMQDLRIVLDWYPEFAEAYNLLGMARLQGGGNASAMEAMRAAMRLEPRNQTYVLNMARIYMAAKKCEAASALLDRLKLSSDPKIAAAARQNLADLPMLRQYGIAPQHPENAQAAKAPALVEPPRPSATAQTAGSSKPAAKAEEASDDDDSEDEAPPREPTPDKRRVQFLKGKLLSVDCSQPPAAVIVFVSGAKSLRLRTEDYKSLLLIGVDQFSCDWSNRTAEVNYKAGGKADGDLVSLEVQ